VCRADYLIDARQPPAVINAPVIKVNNDGDIALCYYYNASIKPLSYFAATF